MAAIYSTIHGYGIHRYWREGAEGVFFARKVSFLDHMFVYFCLFIPTQCYLFALYVDDLIVQLNHFHVGHVFAGCTLYADDVALLTALWYGLEKFNLMVKYN